MLRLVCFVLKTMIVKLVNVLRIDGAMKLAKKTFAVLIGLDQHELLDLEPTAMALFPLAARVHPINTACVNQVSVKVEFVPLKVPHKDLSKRVDLAPKILFVFPTIALKEFVVRINYKWVKFVKKMETVKPGYALMIGGTMRATRLMCVAHLAPPHSLETTPSRGSTATRLFVLEIHAPKMTCVKAGSASLASAKRRK